MQRTTSANNVGSLPSYASGGETPGYYTDLVSGGPGTAGTLVGAADMNMIQEEIVNVIEDIGGLTLDSADNTQMAKALGALRTGATTTGTENTARTRTLLAATQSTASGDNSAVVASNNSTASGDNSLVGGASFGTASGANSAVIVGSFSTASGAHAVAIGNSGSFCSGDRSVLLGSTKAELADDDCVGVGYSSGSNISETGTNQNLTIVLRAVDGQVICKLLKIQGLIDYADNAAAISGGLLTGDVYYTASGGSSVLKIVT